MKHLVLGSSGQIGSYLTLYLQSAGESVIEFDLENNAIQDLRIFNNGYLEELVNASDFVHFLAFDVGGAHYLRSKQDSFDFISNNIKIMLNTFEILHKTRKPFIFISSQMSDITNSTYGRLKLIGESYTKSLNGLFVRCWNIFGYERYPEKFHVITDFVNAAKRNKVIKMLTDGTEQRQFLFALDAAECLYILSKEYNNLDKNKNYHITSFQWIRIIDLARIIGAQFIDCKIIPSNFKDTIQYNRIEPDRHILNYWEPKTKLEEGINKVMSSMELRSVVV